MSAPGDLLDGFAYGENVAGVPERSLGYSLVAPAKPASWSVEVEMLARQLQATPYPDNWPQAELFCSVLLADGHRLIAIARYGLADHTSSRRRGGLELVGVIASRDLAVTSCLAIYRWLQRRRRDAQDLHALGGQSSLNAALAACPPSVPPTEIPLLPIRLWQEGSLLFSATAPSDPDHRLGLLEQAAPSNWQWLPLVGPDFALQTYAQRGPLIAWTPHLADVAVKLDRKPAEGLGILFGAFGRVAWVSLALVLLVLGAANLWATLSIGNSMQALPQESMPVQVRQAENPVPFPDTGGHSIEQFVGALEGLIHQQGNVADLSSAEINKRYEHLSANNRDLALAGNTGKRVAVEVSVLASRTAARIEASIRKALTNKGYDQRLVDLACQQVREQLSLEAPSGQ